MLKPGSYFASNASSMVANNIIAYNGIGVGVSGSAPKKRRNNCVYGSSFTNYSGCSAAMGDVTKEPLFMDRNNFDFHLISNSPCVDAGYDSDVQTGWVDIDEQGRIGGDHVDMGADED